MGGNQKSQLTLGLRAGPPPGPALQQGGARCPQAGAKASLQGVNQGVLRSRGPGGGL